LPTSVEPTARAQLLELQRATFARLEEDLRTHRHRESKEVRQFRQRYQKEISRYRKISNRTELTKQVLRSDIVYCGDFHTLRQAQRTPIRILRTVLEMGRRVVLALEMIPRSGQEAANKYVKGEIEEAQLLDEISYRTRWGFEWEHYRQLFDLARAHEIPLVALNTDIDEGIPLRARDDLAADLITEASLSSPESMIFCLYGDLHVAEAHIPRKVDLRLKKHKMQRKTLIIFQNSEPIYWQLAQKGLAHDVDVVEISSNKFCVLSAAPWIKWQSYASWLEDQSDLLGSTHDTEGFDDFLPDYYHQVSDLADRIADFLKLIPAHLQQFSVYTASDVEIINAIQKYCDACKTTTLPIENLIRSELVVNRSCYFPKSSILYLSDLSANRAAEKAAQLVAAKIHGNDWVYGDAKDIHEIFYRIVLWEAIGFLGSKIINPKRKCDQYRDFDQFLRKSRGSRLQEALRDKRAVAVQVLAHRQYELKRLHTKSARGTPRKLFRLSPKRFFLAASALGQIMANRLYIAMVSDEVPLRLVRELFSPLPKRKFAARNHYWHIVEEIQSHHHEPVSKDEHF